MANVQPEQIREYIKNFESRAVLNLSSKKRRILENLILEFSMPWFVTFADLCITGLDFQRSYREWTFSAKEKNTSVQTIPIMKEPYTSF